MSALGVITVDDVMAAAEKVAKGSRKVNPVDGKGSCVYSNSTGRRHCLAGTILLELGLPIPEFGHKDNNMDIKSIAHLWWPELDVNAMLALRHLQNDADEGIKWGEAWRRPSR